MIPSQFCYQNISIVKRDEHVMADTVNIYDVCSYILLKNFCYLKQPFINSVPLHTVEYTFNDIIDINQYKLNLKQISQFQGLLAYFSQQNP